MRLKLLILLDRPAASSLALVGGRPMRTPLPDLHFANPFQLGADCLRVFPPEADPYSE